MSRPSERNFLASVLTAIVADGWSFAMFSEYLMGWRSVDGFAGAAGRGVRRVIPKRPSRTIGPPGRGRQPLSPARQGRNSIVRMTLCKLSFTMRSRARSLPGPMRCGCAVAAGRLSGC